jgi:putative hemolysin
MTEETNNEDKQEHPADASAQVIVYDHLKIVDNETGKEIVNKRG